jgi:hypothetical protein
MTSSNVMQGSLESVSWQDYRASNTSMVVFYTSDPISELPIREIPEELPSDIPPEPNYETGTYGYFGCSKSKIRNAFHKAKIRYLIFMTKYAGTNADFKDKYFITGYYRITKASDVKRLHIRHLPEYSCLDEDQCYALKAELVRFVALENAFELTDKVLKSWDHKARITKQTRIILNEEQTMKVIEFLNSKDDFTSEYVKETERLQPHGAEGEEDDESPEE